MKTQLCAALAVLALTAGGLSAQDFVAPSPSTDQQIREEKIIRPRPTIEGIVKEVFTKKPWQAINPLAPASYGSGEKFVSKDHGPGTPYHSTGLVVMGVEW